jgi:hypothetical protein
MPWKNLGKNLSQSLILRKKIQLKWYRNQDPLCEPPVSLVFLDMALELAFGFGACNPGFAG